MVAWAGKFCFGLAEVLSLVFLVLFKDGTQGESKDLVIIIIVFVAVVRMFQNRQVIVTSLGFCCCSGGAPPLKSQLLEFLQRQGEDECRGRWRMITVLSLKMYVRISCKI